MWKEITNYSKYQVSNEGKVRRKKTDGTFRVLRPGVDNTGYRRVYLYRAGAKRKQYRIHQLVAKHFVEPFKGHHVEFKSGNKLDVSAGNLKWKKTEDVGIHLDENTGNYLSVEYNKNRKIFKGYHPTKEKAQNARRVKRG